MSEKRHRTAASRLLSAIVALVCAVLILGATNGIARAQREKQSTEERISTAGVFSLVPVNNAVKIKFQPKSYTVPAGTEVELKVTLTTYDSRVRYQWQYKAPGSSAWANSTGIGARDNILKFTTRYSHNGYQYRCQITDTDGLRTYTNIVTITIVPKITIQPMDTVVTVGTKAQLTVEATGMPTLKYQWQYKAPGATTWLDSGQSGAKTNTLTISTNVNHHGYLYRCKVTDGTTNSVFSNVVTLETRPKITVQPANATVEVGKIATFSVTVTGKGKLTYQWQCKAPGAKDWSNSTQSGAKTQTLKVTTNIYHEGYQYRCVVTDANGMSNNSNAAAISIEVPIDETHFPDECFRELLLNWVDGNNDQKLSGSELKITELDASDEMIASLQGIEYFKALKKLYCYDCMISTLDVSKNTKLECLQCWCNEMKSLNVSKNASLLELVCDINDLSTLNLSGCKNLRILICGGNDFETLDVSKNPNLEEIDCYGTPLTALDVSNNPVLERIKCGEFLEINGAGPNVIIERMIKN